MTKDDAIRTLNNLEYQMCMKIPPLYPSNETYKLIKKCRIILEEMG